MERTGSGSRVSAQVVIALITAFASLGAAWITATFQAKSATDERLMERKSNIQDIIDQMRNVEPKVRRMQTDLADIQGRVSSLNELLRSQKVCSVVNPPNWRDSFSVPHAWTANECSQFAATVNATQWQLVCISDQGFSFGPTNGGVPPDNRCGW
jgi:hypothetical protein